MTGRIVLQANRRATIGRRGTPGKIIVRTPEVVGKKE
jgi:hypothetical protein